MADPDSSNPQPKTARDDMHWGINYLREDIQDLRAENRESRADTKAEFGAVRKEMQEGFAALRAEMQEGFARLESKYDARFHLLLGVTVTLNGMLAALMTALIKL